MRYNEAAEEVKWLLDQIDWLSTETISGLRPYDHTIVREAGNMMVHFEECIGVHDGDGADPQLICLPSPFVMLLSFGYTVTGRLDTASEIQTTRNPGPTQNRETDWIAVSRFGGEEINTMDGFTGLSRQIIRVSLFSLDRERVSLMADEVVKKINNFTGRTRSHNEMDEPRGLDFQCCLLDEVFDNNDEESSINGMDMFFVVVVSG